mgnify:FL=1
MIVAVGSSQRKGDQGSSAEWGPMESTQPFVLSLGAVLAAAGLDPHDVLAIRHTYKESGLPSRAAATPERVLAYTREQHHVGKFPKEPARHWLIFMGEGGRRSRLTAVYENRGEAVAERTERHRYYDVAPVPLLASLEERLVVEWSADPVNWAKRGPLAARFPVLEIADPTTEAFPGFDHVLLSYGDLQSMVTETRYAGWRTALQAVRGIYLIADETAGQCYVGKADGERGVLGRWEAYARDGHGGNVALRDALELDPAQPERYTFSLLRVFGSNTPQAQIDAAEKHYKEALMTRRFGLNRN